MQRHQLLQAIAATIAEAVGSADKLRLCVGLSGGSDSVALLHALRALGHQCHCLHCNFHLRGEESDSDEAFCRRLCLRLGVPLVVEQCDVSGRRKQSPGESIEMIARDMRYAAFERYRRSNDIDYIAVAHHREDNVETFFLNLLRSAGAKGLSGMATLSEGHILRPMLHIPKTLIMDYIEANSLEYVIDSSNATDDYQRNRVRHHVIPMLAELFPGALDAIRESMDVLRQQSLTLEADTRRLRSDYLRSDGSIDVAALTRAEASPTDALYRLGHPLGLSAAMVRDIVADVNTSGRRFGGYELRHGVLMPPADEAALPVLTIERVTLASKDDLRCLPRQLILDAERVDPGLLRLGATRRGLRFEPFGMRGSKLVSDLLREADVPISRREGFPMLYYDGMPIWVVGVRGSRHYVVEADATYPHQAIRITVSGD